jgi:hypothetical protein
VSNGEAVSHWGRNRETADLLLKAVPLAALIIYAIGFVISNNYYADLSIPTSELLQTRFLGAGLLFVILFLVPCLLEAAILIQAFWFLRPLTRNVYNLARRRPRAAQEEESSSKFLALVATAYLVFEGWARVLGGVTGNRRLFLTIYSSQPPYEAYSSFWVGVLVLSFMYWIIRTRDHPWVESLHSHRLPYALAALRTSLVAPSCLAVILSFADSIYPQVNPAFGGAAATRAELRIAGGVDTSLGVELGRDCEDQDCWLSVAIIDRTPTSITFALCESGNLRVLSVPGGRLVALQTHRRFIALASLERECKEAPQKWK